jgi:molecular chaperone HscB
VSGETHFERLGLPRRFALDPAEVERNYLARSRALHPDYHQLASGAEQRASMELTAALNEAYATLRQPFRRAEYLLALEGGPTAAEHKEMAPAFLEEMLELRMEIEELRESGPADTPAKSAMARQLTQRRKGLEQYLAAAFAKLEALPDGDPGRKPLLVQVRQVLNAAKYVEGLLRDLRAD